MIKSIPTEYSGYLFRSRLEARWAFYFDRSSIAWDYEPEGFRIDSKTKYLPDFWLPEQKCFVEIKPNVNPARKEVAKCKAVSTKYKMVLICGDPLEHRAMVYVDGDRSACVAKRAMKDWLRIDLIKGDPEIHFIEPGERSSTHKQAAEARRIRFEHGETPVVKKAKPPEAPEKKGNGDANLAAIREMLKR